MEILHLQAIEKKYQASNKKNSDETVFSIKPTTVTLQEGEFFSLLGPSGCGKTTLLKLVAGLLTPDGGDILLEGKKLTSVVPEKRGFSMVFQDALLFPHMTVAENVAFGLKMKGVRKKQRLEKVTETLAAVGLKGFENRSPSSLSGGQKQRVSLARAIATDPRLLLMDEPFSALDPGLREDMRELVSRMHRDYGVTILFVTHDRDEAFQLSDRIGVMKEGEILQIDRPMDVYEKPNAPYIARFLGTKNVFIGRVQGGIFNSQDLSIQLPADKTIHDGSGSLVIRPEIISIHKEPNGADRLKGTIKSLSFRQGLYEMKVQLGEAVLEMVQLADGHLDVTVGEERWVQVNRDHVHFIPIKEKGTH